MKIQHHDVDLSSSRSMVRHYEKNESLNVWNQNVRLEINNNEEKNRLEVGAWNNSSTLLDISKKGMARFKESAGMNPGQNDDDIGLNYPSKLQIMKILLERFFGIKIEIVDPEDFDADPEAAEGETTATAENKSRQNPEVRQEQGWGIHYTYHELTHEKESVKFKATGDVTTEDGRQIQFSAGLEMSRETVEEVFMEFRAGDALIDPLVLNTDGKGVQLTDEKYQFDLDADGEMDNISFVESGSGFLVYDKNKNGIVDDGSELFGPATNNGFLELQAYDADNNSWIDENDAIYYQLSLWTKNADGADQLSSLQESDVGAIFLQNSKTEFHLEEGKLRETGVYLKESGGTGFIQEVDLEVE